MIFGKRKLRMVVLSHDHTAVRNKLGSTAGWQLCAPELDLPAATLHSSSVFPNWYPAVQCGQETHIGVRHTKKLRLFAWTKPFSEGLEKLVGEPWSTREPVVS